MGVETSRIAANSQRFRATVWLREFWSRFHSDSLRDSVMGRTSAMMETRLRNINHQSAFAGDTFIKIKDIYHELQNVLSLLKDAL